MEGDVRVWIFIGVFLTLKGMCLGLQCWQCLADDCQEDPSKNYKATKRNCKPGESCQKVYYEVHSLIDKRDYDSTVRSCSSGQCEPQNDFLNCTEGIKLNPGCIRRTCCNDRDLCNAAIRTIPEKESLFMTTIVILIIGKTLQVLQTRSISHEM
ncbi:unnamed protein product [Owenia fusiformis]|uniref:Uncharacterized protein n=1 Tax=Owenia fusiformis TaxID=6347 RepID=A0A8J1UIU9_OWEFU|nr:unnamed protein product [Owenia fusiformis]